MNENYPVKLLYTTSSLLSANAPKQNTFAMNSFSSSSMTFRPGRGACAGTGWFLWITPYAVPGYAWGSWKSGNIGGLTAGIGSCTWCKVSSLAGWISLGITGTGVICGGTGVAGIFVCASNAVPGSLHVTFWGGGAQIEVLRNHFFRHVGATTDKSLVCCF